MDAANCDKGVWRSSRNRHIIPRQQGPVHGQQLEQPSGEEELIEAPVEIAMYVRNCVVNALLQVF